MPFNPYPTAPQALLPGNSLPVGHVGVICHEPDIRQSYFLNRSGARPTAGGPRYDVVNRVWRTGVAEYTGDDPVRMSVSIILDQYLRRLSLEPWLDNLTKLATYNATTRKMPELQLIGPVPFRERRWYLDGYPDWDDDPEPIRLSDNKLVRQALTLNLVEIVEDSLLAWSVSQSKRGKGKRKASTKARQGDTLYDIAARELKDRNRAIEIGRLNNIPLGRKLKRNQKIRLP